MTHAQFLKYLAYLLWKFTTLFKVETHPEVKTNEFFETIQLRPSMFQFQILIPVIIEYSEVIWDCRAIAVTNCLSDKFNKFLRLFLAKLKERSSPQLMWPDFRLLQNSYSQVLWMEGHNDPLPFNVSGRFALEEVQSQLILSLFLKCIVPEWEEVGIEEGLKVRTGQQVGYQSHLFIFRLDTEIFADDLSDNFQSGVAPLSLNYKLVVCEKIPQQQNLLNLQLKIFSRNLPSSFSLEIGFGCPQDAIGISLLPDHHINSRHDQVTNHTFFNAVISKDLLNH